MSQYWHIECRRCKGAATEGVNHGKDELVSAIKVGPALVEMSKVFDLNDLHFQSNYERGGHIANFVLTHLECDAFYVVCEYSSYEPVHVSVRPGLPGHDGVMP